MIAFKCRGCGAELSIDRSGALVCEFCGSKQHFSDSELGEYKAFRKQMLDYLRSLHDSTDTDSTVERLWNMADTIHFTNADGADITLKYIYTAQDGPASMYVTRNAVLYHFKKQDAKLAAGMEEGLRMLEYPEADIKGLQKCFPKQTGRFTLSDGSVLLAFKREETFFPLSVYGALPGAHVAWIISRMENIACVLEYSQIEHGGINTDSFFINPVTHEGALYGGWWNARKKHPLKNLPNKDLIMLRATARRMLGVNNRQYPRELDFFLDEQPVRDAFEDFQVWDKVIEEGFGGHNFRKMDVTDNIKL